MKKLFLIATVAFIFGCNNEKAKDDTKKDESKSPESKVDFPAKMTYEGSPTPGKKENIVSVMNFNLDFIAGKLDNIGSYLADSVHLVFADGTDMNTVRDTVVATIKAWRESMSSAKQSYLSAIAVDNKDMGHEWVMQWINESHEYKDGKKEHMIYHEDYRMENGKIRELFQYAQGVPEKK